MLFTKKNILTISTILIFIYIVGFFVTREFLPEGQMTSEDIKNFNIIYLLNLSYILGGFAAYLGIKRFSLSGSIGKSLFFLGLYQFIMVGGFTAWFVMETLLKQEAYPSVADFFYVISTPTAFIGVYFLLKIFTLEVSKKVVAQAVLLGFLAAFALFKIAGLSFPTFEEGVSLTTALFDTYYTFADVLILMIAVIMLRIAGGKIFGGLLTYIVGMIAIIVADLTFFARVDNETYYTGDISDAFYVIAGCILSVGIYKIILNFLPKNEFNK